MAGDCCEDGGVLVYFIRDIALDDVMISVSFIIIKDGQ